MLTGCEYPGRLSFQSNALASRLSGSWKGTASVRMFVYTFLRTWYNSTNSMGTVLQSYLSLPKLRNPYIVEDWIQTLDLWRGIWGCHQVEHSICGLATIRPRFWMIMFTPWVIHILLSAECNPMLRGCEEKNWNILWQQNSCSKRETRKCLEINC